MSDISLNDGRSGENRHSSSVDPLKREVDAAREKAGEAADTIREEAAHFAEATKSKASDKVEQGKESVATAVADFAEAIRKAGETLDDKNQAAGARLAMQAAEGLETFSRVASEKSSEEMLNVVRDFGRSNPTAFLAASVLAGVALGRFAKSSASHERPSDNLVSSSRDGVQTTTSDHSPPSVSSKIVDAADTTVGVSQLESQAAPRAAPVGMSVLGEEPDGHESSRVGN